LSCTPSEDIEPPLTSAEIDERISVAIREERARWERALRDTHIEMSETIRVTVDAALGRAEAMTEDAVKQLLACTTDMLQKFDLKVRECLEQDRRMLGLTTLHDRRMN